MRAGALRSRVTIQSLGNTYDDYGDLSDSWTSGDTVWAAIVPVGGTQVDIAKEMVGVVTHIVKMRFRSNVPLAASGARVHISNYALLDAGDTLSIIDGNGQNHDFVADTDFDVETSNNVTAGNLATAIDADSAFSAEHDGTYVNIDQLIVGAAGNDDPSKTGDGWTIIFGMSSGADGLTPDNRLLYNTGGSDEEPEKSQVLQIESVLNWQERNVFLELLCKEVTL